jgi:hypothetical protein
MTSCIRNGSGKNNKSRLESLCILGSAQAF